MVRKVKVGEGITARTVTMYDVTGNAPGDIRAARDAFRKGDREHWESVSEHGLFATSTASIRQTCNAILAAADDSGDFEADSPECFARRIIWLLDIAAEAVKRGDPEDSAIYGIQIGDLWRAAVMKWRWQPHALRGQKVLDGASKSARERKEENEPLRKMRLKRMTALISTGMTATDAARECEAEGLGDWRAIIRQVNRAKAKARERRDTTATVPNKGH